MGAVGRETRAQQLLLDARARGLVAPVPSISDARPRDRRLASRPVPVLPQRRRHRSPLARGGRRRRERARPVAARLAGGAHVDRGRDVRRRRRTPPRPGASTTSASTCTCSISTPTCTACTTTSSRTACCGSCFHGLFDPVRRPRFDQRFREAWDAYVAVNEAFAERRPKRRPAERRSCSCRTTNSRSCPRSCARSGPTCGSCTSRTRRSAAPTASACSRRRRRAAVRLAGERAGRVPHARAGPRVRQPRRARCSATRRDDRSRFAASLGPDVARARAEIAAERRDA